MTIATKITLTDAKLQDLAVAGINAKLLPRLAWLNFAFGIAVKKPNDKGFFPAFETDTNDTKNYEPLFPNEDLGAFSFWDTKDGAMITQQGDFINMNFNVGLVVWGDLRKVYSGAAWKGRNVQNVLFEVLEALKAGGFGCGCHVKMKEFSLEGRNIYPGYSIQEIENQYLMRPFFGFRIDCEIYAQQKCNP